MSDSLRPHRQQPTRLLCPWDSPGKNTGVGCHFPLQRIFLTQGSNPGLLYYRQILHHLSHQGRPIKHEFLECPSAFYSSDNTLELLHFCSEWKSLREEVENYLLSKRLDALLVMEVSHLRTEHGFIWNILTFSRE